MVQYIRSDRPAKRYGAAERNEVTLFGSMRSITDSERSAPIGSSKGDIPRSGSFSNGRDIVIPAALGDIKFEVGPNA